MKKSWHPLLLKNQERVWLEEKKALEEKKKLDQLRKEKEEERQLQELQRLQEEQTGKKRTEKLEWMYATPATGTNQNANDLEDYLLGKKRVDKILTADENAKIGASHKNFIAVQNANNARDIAAKIREDPLLAIKQQEQAAYQALLSNPLRFREMQERNGIKPKRSSEEKAREKEKRRKEKEEKKRLKHERKHHRDNGVNCRLSPAPQNKYNSRRSPSPRDRSSERDYKRRRNDSYSPPPHRRFRDQQVSQPPNTVSEDRASRLAAMTSNANAMSRERQERLSALLEKEKADLAADEAARAKSKGMGNFLSYEQKKVFGGSGGLEDRIKRGRGCMVGNLD